MKTNNFFLNLFLTLFSCVVFAQGSLRFDDSNHNFGVVKEDGGYIEHVFKFVNNGNEPIKITNVRASCGCTTPRWSSEMINPSDSGEVVARYNPFNRPGGFNKSLTITTSNPNFRKVLYISGTVKSKPANPEQEFSVKADEIGFKERFFNFGKILTKEPITKEFDCYNHGNNIFFIDSLAKLLPPHLKIALKEDSLNAKQSGTLLITYDAKKKNDFGSVSDQIRLGNQLFSVIASIEEYFPNMTPEKFDLAPKLLIENRFFEFGKVKKGTKVEATFTLKNNGAEKLNFRKVKANCGCLDFKLKKSTLKKGKSQELKVIFDTSDQEGNQYKSVSLFSNDPAAPTQIVTLKGVVEKEG